MATVPKVESASALDAAAGVTASRHAVLIRATRGFARLRLKELWDSRELLYFLAWRDVKVRYRQTFFGIAWAVGQPVLMVAIFSIFLGRLAHVPSEGLPYPVFVFAGLLPWTLFAQILQGASESLVRSSDLITKVYFPRLLLPMSVGTSYLLDFLITACVLGTVLAVYHQNLSATVLFLPLLLLMIVCVPIAVGTWLSALNVKYRDVRHTIPFLVQVWLFVTPVVYPLSIVPEKWRLIYSLNPMVGVVEGFRWALTDASAAPLGPMLISLAVTAIIMAGGLVYFQRVERGFADVI